MSGFTWTYSLLLSSLLLLGGGDIGCAQDLPSSILGGSRPEVGGTGGLRPPSKLPLLEGSQDAAVKVHLDAVGKPCLSVKGEAKSQTINPNIFNHLIIVSSNCSLTIKLQVCYYHTRDCTLVAVPGYARKEATLGIMPGMSAFRFEYREQFDNSPGSLGSGYQIN
jgi:hypothetical protein